ncbi:MAG: hypothetical protein HEP71_00375 [Roseivirga sp.]|nr:hypothetical protein [Roseivirga sp.]
MPIYPPGHHKEEIEKQQRNRWWKALLAYGSGIVLLLIFQYLRTSPDMADFMAMINRARTDWSFGIQVVGILIMYILPAAGLTTILATTWFLLFRKDN